MPAIDWISRKKKHTEYALSRIKHLPFTPILLEIHYGSSNLAPMPPSFYWVVRGDALPISQATSKTLNHLLHLIILPNKEEIHKWK